MPEHHHHHHRRRHHRHRHRAGALRESLTQREAALLFVVLGVVLAALFFGVYQIGRRIETSAYTEPVGELKEGFGQIPTLEMAGRTYAKKLNLTTILLMGVDMDEERESTDARHGGQADFQLLLVLDHDEKVVRQLQIDRNTVTPVRVTTIFGEDGGVRPLQICLAHGFGATREECCKNAVEAVETFLNGADVDLYVSVPLDAVGVFNDMLGGVTVSVPIDMTNADPAMREGAVIRLSDSQAETFVRARMNVGDGSNEARMVRQRIYMDAAREIIAEKTGENARFLENLYDNLSGYMTTNMAKGRLINEMNKAYRYEVLPVETLPGEYGYAANGTQEFYADEQEKLGWVLNTFYTLRR